MEWNYKNVYPPELCHYGIKDMHWYQRRFQNPDGTLTPAGKERYRKQSQDHKDASELKKKHVSEMTNAELRKLNERQNLERQYRQLNPTKIKKGLQYCATVASIMGTVTLLKRNSGEIISMGKDFIKSTAKGTEFIKNYRKVMWVL